MSVSFDVLRRAPAGDPTADAYKDWLHLNVIDPVTGLVGLVNASLHGDPRDPRAVAVGAALMHLPGRGWLTAVEVAPASTAAIGLTSIGLPGSVVVVDPVTGTVAAEVRAGASGIDLAVQGRPVLPAYELARPVPFGHGWIAWRVVPRLRLRGSATLDGQRIPLDSAVGYHDHNWGRWHWGDDIGWRWGAFVAPEPAPVLVLSHATDRHHRRGTPVLTVHSAGPARTFAGECVSVRWEGRYSAPLVRTPGGMAALHVARAWPRLPTTVHIDVRDGADRLAIHFVVQTAAQVVAGEPMRRGYSFIHELVGSFECMGTLAGANVALTGLGIVEHVD